MIGGFDRFLYGPCSREDLTIVVRLLREVWKDALVECPDTLPPTPIGSSDLFPLPSMTEVFVYRDRETFLLCESEGVVPGVSGKVLWVSLEPTALSFVLDDEGTELDLLVSDLIEAVRSRRRFLGRRAA